MFHKPNYRKQWNAFIHNSIYYSINTYELKSEWLYVSSHPTKEQEGFSTSLLPLFM